MHEQVDGTYTYNIENMVHKVCILARETGEEHEKRCLRASSLQCLSAMVTAHLLYFLFLSFFSFRKKMYTFQMLFFLVGSFLPLQVWFMAEFSHILADFDEVSYFLFALLEAN